jgi:hypothetical protein
MVLQVHVAMYHGTRVPWYTCTVHVYVHVYVLEYTCTRVLEYVLEYTCTYSSTMVLGYVLEYVLEYVHVYHGMDYVVCSLVTSCRLVACFSTAFSLFLLFAFCEVRVWL